MVSNVRERAKERMKISRRINSMMKRDSQSNLMTKKLSKKLFAANIEKQQLHKNNIRSWAIEYNIQNRALSALLKILITFGSRNLPSDSRSLLRTPRSIQIENTAGGQYWYNGIGNCLRNVFGKLNSNITLELNFNVDGLPLFKSSPVTFWPILANIHGMSDVKPMVIGIWSGIGKPKDLTDFLQPLVSDIDTVIRNGVMINEYRIDIVIRCFLCDSPARSFIKGIAYFNSKYGCQKCYCIGVFDKNARRMHFAEFNKPKRTNNQFLNRFQKEHHREESILQDLKNLNGEPLIDMIKQFPTSDPLHLLEEGVMKKVLNIWMHGKDSYKKKWSKEIQEILSAQISIYNKELPSDINRNVRTLQFIKYWKATEFRTVLLYYGMVAFKDYLGEQEYIHFLNLCLAVRIYSCRSYVNKYKTIARKLCLVYCEKFGQIYGINNIVSNIHNVIHICDDVDQFGPLTEISTYPFENFLREIKMRVKPSNTNIEQISRRLVEMSLDISENKKIDMNARQREKSSWTPELKYQFNSSNQSTFKFIRITPNVFFSVKKIGDRWFLTKSGDIVEMKYAIRSKNSYFIIGEPIKRKYDFFMEPYSSHKTDIFLCDTEKNNERMYHYGEIKSKLVCLTYKDQFVFIPLIHSIDECSEFLSK
ncbi:uncharacterized protein LOC129579676 [Sitodiplosis mosellana]|uniref:uncharacterized protein LOC129579675 n=1 Tax=Sitodiplosis mosellana TaxID=263140 RepID=UPI00244394F8|nr:uncharacterized protein LOC129579675 [Sitodiplosis mosellana]XP_055325815.1 uncharacterized protein LOC129579675 [Sitodiplosis mosellana]XP_055325816.1 uncharacterized protein LOC129579676 [Sitodiplosis mosellana]